MSMLLCVCVPESTNTLVARLLVKLEQMEFNWINTLKQFKLSSSSSCRIIFNITPSTAPLSRAINFGCQRILNLLIDFHPNQIFSFVSFIRSSKRTFCFYLIQLCKWKTRTRVLGIKFFEMSVSAQMYMNRFNECINMARYQCGERGKIQDFGKRRKFQVAISITLM